MGNTLNKTDKYAILTASETSDIEHRTVDAGTSFYQLMQSAGTAVFEEITQTFSPQPTLVLCGPGNNGGDGYVVATQLHKAGWPVKVATRSTTAPMSDFAMKHRQHYTGKTIDLTPDFLGDTSLIVDGLFGTGLERPLSGIYANIVEAVNTSGLDCVAIDIPSGIHTDTGSVMGTALKAHTTVTFSFRKPGHYLMPGRAYTGKLICRDIGLQTMDSDQLQLMVNRPELWHEQVPHPHFFDHKYSRGHLLIRGGTLLTGAGRLASAAARRIGAGMVTLACAPEVQHIYALSAPGLITTILDKENSFKSRLLEKPKSAALLGPGNGVTSETRQAVLETLAAQIPCVLDADALTVFQDNPKDLFNKIKAPCVMTPHTGEFKRLFPLKGDKIKSARNAAKQSGAVVLFKGPDTVIADPCGLAVIQDNAPPTLATAGTGDVLAGLIAGFLAQGLDPFVATCISSWIHGESANHFGPGLIAEDLIEMIPLAISDLLVSPDST